MPRGSTHASIDNYVEVCEREGFPEVLSEAAAADLGDIRPGATVTVLYPGGQGTAKVTEATCVPEEEYEPAATLLTLDAAVGPAATRGMPIDPPNFLLWGTTPHPEAGLLEPRKYAGKPPHIERVREVLTRR